MGLGIADRGHADDYVLLNNKVVGVLVPPRKLKPLAVSAVSLPAYKQSRSPMAADVRRWQICSGRGRQQYCPLPVPALIVCSRESAPAPAQGKQPKRLVATHTGLAHLRLTKSCS